MSNICVLNEWSYQVLNGIDSVQSLTYCAPEQLRPRLVGKVFNHPKKGDGKLIAIGNPIYYNKETRTIVTASGSCYCLGPPSTSYKKVYPNCQEDMHKFLSNLPEQRTEKE